jgi:hypothetical protein
MKHSTKLSRDLVIRSENVSWMIAHADPVAQADRAQRRAAVLTHLKQGLHTDVHARINARGFDTLRMVGCAPYHGEAPWDRKLPTRHAHRHGWQQLKLL